MPVSAVNVSGNAAAVAAVEAVSAAVATPADGAVHLSQQHFPTYRKIRAFVVYTTTIRTDLTTPPLVHILSQQLNHTITFSQNHAITQSGGSPRGSWRTSDRHDTIKGCRVRRAGCAWCYAVGSDTDGRTEEGVFVNPARILFVFPLTSVIPTCREFSLCWTPKLPVIASNAPANPNHPAAPDRDSNRPDSTGQGRASSSNSRRHQHSPFTSGAGSMTQRGPQQNINILVDRNTHKFATTKVLWA